MAADGEMAPAERKLFARAASALQVGDDELNRLIDEVVEEPAGGVQHRQLGRHVESAAQADARLERGPQHLAVHLEDAGVLLALDRDGNVYGGCSTSGLAYKLPGRVGDSPIIGSGLYVDGQVGAAGATGVGENVLRYCASFLIVEYMRQGKSPTDACEAAIRRVAEGDNKKPEELRINFVALNKAGEIGAAGTDDGFRMAVVDNEKSTVVLPRKIV